MDICLYTSIHVYIYIHTYIQMYIYRYIFRDICIYIILLFRSNANRGPAASFQRLLQEPLDMGGDPNRKQALQKTT